MTRWRSCLGASEPMGSPHGGIGDAGEDEDVAAAAGESILAGVVSRSADAAIADQRRCRPCRRGRRAPCCWSSGCPGRCRTPRPWPSGEFGKATTTSLPLDVVGKHISAGKLTSTVSWPAHRARGSCRRAYRLRGCRRPARPTSHPCRRRCRHIAADVADRISAVAAGEGRSPIPAWSMSIGGAGEHEPARE